MGKGDKKSKRGKISMGSYGNTRKRKKDKPAETPVAIKAEKAPAAEKPKKKAAAKK